MTEEQVREKGIPYECGIARFRETSRGHIMGLNTGFMKMIFALEDPPPARRAHRRRRRDRTDPYRPGRAQSGRQLDYFVENTFNYPTLAEAYKIAALDAWNRMPRS